MFGEEGAVKIDSDTVVTGTSWVKEGAPLCGFCPGIYLICRGFAYWCRKDAADEAIKAIEGRWHSKDIYGEDQLITSEMMHLYGQGVKIYHWHQQRFAGGISWGKRNNLDLFSEAEVVTFGNVKGRPGKKAVARAMGFWTDEGVLP